MPDSASERVACAVNGCPNTILPATAKRTGGYCGPCAAKRDRAAQEAYVLANRRDLDRFAGVTDPVTLLQLMHTPPKPDRLVRLLPPPKSFEALYGSITLNEAQRLMRYALERLDEDEHVAANIATYLAAFTPYPLDDMLKAWLARREPYPAIIFRDAKDGVREKLFGLLNRSTSQSRANHTLAALAWIGDEAVAHFLHTADAQKPAWSKSLYIGPAAYARVAGWELDGSERRDLTFNACVALRVDPKDDERTDAVKVMQPQDTERCRWCRGKLANLIEVNFDDRLFNAFRLLGDYLAVLTCPLCTCYGTFFAELDDSGRGRWAIENKRPDHLPADIEAAENPWTQAAIGLQPRRTLHGADWCLPTTLSQIGGIPAWVQDAEYPVCPRCARTMMFLAQIDQAAFPHDEGIYYAFFCKTCRTTATCYQQT